LSWLVWVRDMPTWSSRARRPAPTWYTRARRKHFRRMWSVPSLKCSTPTNQQERFYMMYVHHLNDRRVATRSTHTYSCRDQNVPWVRRVVRLESTSDSALWILLNCQTLIVCRRVPLFRPSGLAFPYCLWWKGRRLLVALCEYDMRRRLELSRACAVDQPTSTIRDCVRMPAEHDDKLGRSSTNLIHAIYRLSHILANVSVLGHGSSMLRIVPSDTKWSVYSKVHVRRPYVWPYPLSAKISLES
jgi:hypothetical protein